MRKHCEQLIFNALKAGIQLKNKWLVLKENLRRSKHFLKPMGLGIGIHYGKVYITRRADGNCRAEGYAINFAKRVESFSRHGKFSHFMLSQDAYDLISASVRKHIQIKQRIYFHKHTPPFDSMKGITQAGPVYELKYWHRLGMPTPPDVVEQYRLIFEMNKSEPWAYYQLFDYFAFEKEDWKTAMEYATEARSANQQDELGLLHMAKCSFKLGFLSQSQRFAEKALELNGDLCLAYELLAQIAAKNDDTQACISFLRNAILISPKSPKNHLNLSVALLSNEQAVEGEHHLKQAIQHYPEYPSVPGFIESFAQLRDEGRLSQDLEKYLETLQEKS